MNATINFKDNELAKTFAKDYSRRTMRGHTVSHGFVSIYGLTENDKIWIDNYISTLNQRITK